MAQIKISYLLFPRQIKNTQANGKIISTFLREKISLKLEAEEVETHFSWNKT